MNNLQELLFITIITYAFGLYFLLTDQPKPTDNLDNQPAVELVFDEELIISSK